MRRDLSASVRVADEQRVVAAMVVEGGSGLVLGTTMASDGAEALVGTFTMALTHPPGLPPMGTPALVVCPQGLAGEVGEALAPLVAPAALPPVREDDPVPEAEDIFDSLVGHLVGRGSSGTPPEPGDWSAAIGAAHRLRACTPWERWDDTVPLDVALTSTSTDAEARYRCVVLGAAAEQLGLVLFPGWVWPDGFGTAGTDEPVVPPEGTLMLFFDRADQVPPELAARAQRYGWPADDEVVPMFAIMEGDSPVEVDRDQVRHLAAAAVAVAAHDRRGPIVLGAGSTTTGTFELPGGEEMAFSVTMGSDGAPMAGAGGAPRAASGNGVPRAAGKPGNGRGYGAHGAASGRGAGTAAGDTVDVLLRMFLDEQRRRLSPKTLRSYEDVVGLLTNCLNGYGYLSLGAADRARWEEAYEQGDEDAFVHLFGAAEIVANVDEFLGSFMVRKVIAGRGLLRSAGTVMNKLVRWLADQGLVGPAEAASASASASQATRDLPRADELSELLWEHSQVVASRLADGTDDGFEEGSFTIERVAPGKLWFDDGRGPVAVPMAASALAEPGWALTGTLVRRGHQWHLVEVGNVYP